MSDQVTDIMTLVVLSEKTDNKSEKTTKNQSKTTKTARFFHGSYIVALSLCNQLSIALLITN